MANLFQVPGNADKLSSSLVKKWNSIILREYDGRSEMHSDYFQLDFNLIRNPTKTAIKWFADSAAAKGAYNAVFEGRSVAFANPLGMYIQSFSDGVLKEGKTPELGDYILPDCRLNITVGYGQNVFQINGVKKEKPEPLVTYGLLRTPLPNGGGDVLRGSGLKYAPETIKNFATEDVCLQFIADTPLGVNRAVVETWKYLQNCKNILFVRFYDGFQREDRRSWLGFHDGISNLKSGAERLDAIEIKPGIQKDEWTTGGTYLYFLRIKVDLGAWNALSLTAQELLVGRKKITGCPLVQISRKKPVSVKGCPAKDTRDISAKDVSGKTVNAAFFDAPMVSNEILLASHIQRANHHISPVSDRNSLRIFRQGYEFLESQGNAPGLSAGLNFISFQDTPERVNRMLTQATWSPTQGGTA